MNCSQSRPTYAARNGFTTLELLVVMGIVLTLLAIAGMYTRSWIIKARVEQQAQQMYADLVSARSRAMNYNRIHFVVLTPAISQYQIWDDTFTAPDGNGQLDLGANGDTQIVSTITKDQLWVNPAGSTQFQFDNRGIIVLPNNVPITIGLTNTFKAAFDCIAVSSTRIRLGRWDGVTNCVQ